MIIRLSDKLLKSNINLRLKKLREKSGKGNLQPRNGREKRKEGEKEAKRGKRKKIGKRRENEKKIAENLQKIRFENFILIFSKKSNLEIQINSLKINPKIKCKVNSKKIPLIFLTNLSFIN